MHLTPIPPTSSHIDTSHLCDLPKDIISHISFFIDRLGWINFTVRTSKSCTRYFHMQKNPNFLIGPYQFFETDTKEFQKFIETLSLIACLIRPPEKPLQIRTSRQAKTKKLMDKMSYLIFPSHDTPCDFMAHLTRINEWFIPMTLKEQRHLYWVVWHIINLQNQLMQTFQTNPFDEVIKRLEDDTRKSTLQMREEKYNNFLKEWKHQGINVKWKKQYKQRRLTEGFSLFVGSDYASCYLYNGSVNGQDGQEKIYIWHLQTANAYEKYIRKFVEIPSRKKKSYTFCIPCGV